MLYFSRRDAKLARIGLAVRLARTSQPAADVRAKDPTELVAADPAAGGWIRRRVGGSGGVARASGPRCGLSDRPDSVLSGGPSVSSLPHGYQCVRTENEGPAQEL